jgi:hypothetical protein
MCRLAGFCKGRGILTLGVPALWLRGGERIEVEVFHRSDPEFKRWLKEHPNGYVLNCYKTGRVHTARCKSYWSAGPRMTYTCAKACSTSEQQLFEWAEKEGIDATRCERC